MNIILLHKLMMYSYSQENRPQIPIPGSEEVLHLNDNLTTTESNVTQEINVSSVYVMDYLKIITFINVHVLLLIMF